MVNFGPLAAEIGSVVWGTKQISTGFASWLHYCTAFEQWAPAKLCGVEQRAPAVLGTAAITSYLPVTLVYCVHTVGWIKMKLGREVGLSPGHILLDEDQLPLPKTGTVPNFWPMSVVAKRLDGLSCHFARR